VDFDVFLSVAARHLGTPSDVIGVTRGHRTCRR